MATLDACAALVLQCLQGLMDRCWNGWVDSSGQLDVENSSQPSVL